MQAFDPHDAQRIALEKADIRLFIDLRSRPLELPAPKQAAVVPAVMELSEAGQVSECVFSALPF